MDHDREPEHLPPTPPPLREAEVPATPTAGPSAGPSATGPAISFHTAPVPRSSSGSQSNSFRQPEHPPHTSLSFERSPYDAGHAAAGGGQPLPPLPYELRARHSRIGIPPPVTFGPRSGVDYIIPFDDKVRTASSVLSKFPSYTSTTRPREKKR